MRDFIFSVLFKLSDLWSPMISKKPFCGWGQISSVCTTDHVIVYPYGQVNLTVFMVGLCFISNVILKSLYIGMLSLPPPIDPKYIIDLLFLMIFWWTAMWMPQIFVFSIHLYHLLCSLFFFYFLSFFKLSQNFEKILIMYITSLRWVFTVFPT